MCSKAIKMIPEFDGGGPWNLRLVFGSVPECKGA